MAGPAAPGFRRIGDTPHELHTDASTSRLSSTIVSAGVGCSVFTFQSWARSAVRPVAVGISTRAGPGVPTLSPNFVADSFELVNGASTTRRGGIFSSSDRDRSIAAARRDELDASWIGPTPFHGCSG